MKKLITFVTVMLTALASSAALSWTEDFDPQKLIIREDSKPKDNVAPRRAADDNKMLEKGKTWWYNIKKHRGVEQTEDEDYAITVGNEVDLDGEKWHELNITKYSYLQGSEWIYCTDTVFVAYMRENEGKLYTRYDLFRTDQSSINTNVRDSWRWYTREFIENPEGTILVMDFSCQSGDSFLHGSDWMNIKFIVEGCGQVTNCNHNYKSLKLRRDYLDFNEYYIKGIGNSDNFNHFFDPYCSGPCAIEMYGNPRLRYVTDISGEVIYEGIGGRKLWEDFAGVEDVATEANTAEVKWYNLQGIQVAKPEVPGIYIRRQGNDSRKVAIR